MKSRRKGETQPAGPDFERVGDLLAGAAFGGAGTAADGGAPSRRPEGVKDDLNRELFLVWAVAVGPDIAREAEPLSFKRGRLTVATSSSALAQTLQLNEEWIRGRLNALLGHEALTAVFFRHAGWERRAGEGAAPGVSRDAPPARADAGTDLARKDAASAEDNAALAEVERMDLSPEIKAVILRGMARAIVRAERDSKR